jgi:hypothetical protein
MFLVTYITKHSHKKYFSTDTELRYWKAVTVFMQIFALMGCCAAEVGKCLPTFRANVAVPPSRIKESKKVKQSKKNNWDCQTLEDGTDILFRDVGNPQSTNTA